MSATSSHRVLVLGGGYAGLAAAARAAKSGARVSLVDARPALVQRIRLHQVLAGQHVPSFPLRSMLERRDVDFEHARVERIDPDRQEVVVHAVRGRPFRLGYDTLVLALGSRVAARVPGVAAHAIRMNDPAELRMGFDRLRALPERSRVTIVGGGASAIEGAAEIAETFPHLALTILSAEPLGATLHPDAAAHLRAWFGSRGVVLREGLVEAVEPDRALLDDGTRLGHELLVWAGGFEGAPHARDAGLAVAADGRALVDPALRAIRHENVFVAGDAASVTLEGRQIRMGCATAMPIGAVAGGNVRRALAREPLRSFRFGYRLRCLSLGRRDGLIQFTASDDTPLPRFLTGSRAALVKELVSRSTVWAVKGEVSLGLPITAWPKDRAVDAPSGDDGATAAGRAA